MSGSVVPYRLSQNQETKEWIGYCKFCDFVSRRSNYPIAAGAEVISHAKKSKREGGGEHYDPVGGLYYPPEELEVVYSQTRQRRQILGSYEDTVNLNQAGL